MARKEELFEESSFCGPRAATDRHSTKALLEKDSGAGDGTTSRILHGHIIYKSMPSDLREYSRYDSLGMTYLRNEAV
ncbi:MAG: hypothetical protein ACETWE_01595 [Candidatus Bathyarchaeia archaeon]